MEKHTSKLPKRTNHFDGQWSQSLIKPSKLFSIICYEYTDMLNLEQLSFCIRWINENFCPLEDFLGYYEFPYIKSDTTVEATKDSLIHL